MYFIKVDLWPNLPSVFRFRYDRDMINWRYGMATYKHYMLSCVNLIIISIDTYLLWLIFLCYFNPILIHKYYFLFKKIIIQPRSEAQEPMLVYFKNNNCYDNNNYDNNSNNYNSNVNNTTNSNGNSNSDNNNNNNNKR